MPSWTRTEIANWLEIFLRIRAIRALLRCTCTRDPKAARRNSARQTLAMSVMAVSATTLSVLARPRAGTVVRKAALAPIASRVGVRAVPGPRARIVSPRRGELAAREALPAPDVAPAVIAEVADGLEGGIQAIYLGSLLAILGFAGFIIVRQVLIRRELDDSAKKMGERIRAGDATAEEYFEMGSIMLRKKVFTQAVRNLKLAAQMWEGDKEDLAQIHNALGFGYLSTDKVDEAISEFNKAVELTPGYVTAWNNLGDALEQKKEFKGAIEAYEESLILSPGNKVATVRLDEIKRRQGRLGLLD